MFELAYAGWWSEMIYDTCARERIMKIGESIALAPRALAPMNVFSEKKRLHFIPSISSPSFLICTVLLLMLGICSLTFLRIIWENCINKPGGEMFAKIAYTSATWASLAHSPHITHSSSSPLHANVKANAIKLMFVFIQNENLMSQDTFFAVKVAGWNVSEATTIDRKYRSSTCFDNISCFNMTQHLFLLFLAVFYEFWFDPSERERTWWWRQRALAAEGSG